MMIDMNPYRSFHTQDQTEAIAHAPPSTLRWVLIGFMIGASIPVAWGAYMLYRASLYAASLPPGTAQCGMGSLAAMIVMIVLIGSAPICGLVGGFVGWIASLTRY